MKFIRVKVAGRTPSVLVNPAFIVTVIETKDHCAEFTLANGRNYVSSCSCFEFLSLMDIVEK